MNIEAFLLCDAATDQHGKLNILGAFDAIYAGEMPCKHPACAIAIRIRFERIEKGIHPFRIAIIDEDGNYLGPQLDGNCEVQAHDNSESTVSNFILNIQGLDFKKYGKYRIDFAMDGQIKGSLPFNVTRIPNQSRL